MARYLFLLFPFLFHTSVLAETVYVTDKLRLNLFELPQSQGKTIKTVSSGESLQILERVPNYAKVRSTDGTIGWTKSAYLVVDKPAVLLVSQMEKEVQRLKKKSTRATKEMKSAIANAEKYQQILQSNEKQSQDQATELTNLKKRAAEYDETMKAYESSVPFEVLIAAIVLFFIVGIALGWYVIDYRIRKRHGGFRIY